MNLTVVFLTVALMSGGAVQPKPDASKAQMLRLYHQNQQLQEKSTQLSADLESMDRRIKDAEKAIANMRYVRAENGRELEAEKKSKHPTEDGKAKHD